MEEIREGRPPIDPFLFHDTRQVSHFDMTLGSECNIKCRQQNLDKLEEKFWQVSDPTHPNYGKFLSRHQVGFAFSITIFSFAHQKLESFLIHITGRELGQTL